jgi:hypothetical protein
MTSRGDFEAAGRYADATETGGYMTDPELDYVAAELHKADLEVRRLKRAIQ